MPQSFPRSTRTQERTGEPSPSHPYEAAILAIWRDLLGRADIDGSVDFFTLGDQSLAPAVVARIRRSLGVDIPVTDVFESRTVSALARAVAARSSAQPRRVTRRRPDAEPVLSFDQHRIWLESQLLPDAVYNNHARRRLVGPLDVAVVERSIGAIIGRHEALRSRFPTVAGRPVQLVAEPDAAWRLRFEDVSGLAGDRLGAAVRLLDADGARQFDLAEGPLLRCLLVKVSDTEHIFGLTLHQIVSDSQSIYRFERELGALYQAGGDVDRADLPTLSIHYRDYAVWQRERLVGETLDRQVRYWHEHLAGAPPVLTLPTTQRRTAAQGADSRRVDAQLSTEDTAGLHELCRAHEVTPFMVLLAGLTTVLGRWSGQSDVVVGVAFEGRADSEVDKLMGIFFNILPMRTELSGDPTFAELLRRVRQVALRGYEHSEAPIDVVVSDLQVVRDPRRTPVFEVVLNVTAPPAVAMVGPLAVEWMGTSTPRTRFDLFINAQEYAGSLRFTFDFGADRFDPALMGQLAAHLTTLLAGVIADPTRSIHDYAVEAAPASPAVPVDPASRAELAPGADWAVERFDLGAADRFVVLGGGPGLRAAAHGTATAAGGTLLDISPAVVGDPARLAGWLRDNDISVIYTTPPIVRALAAVGAGPVVLRYAFVDHDGSLLAHDVDALRTLSAQARCVALYRVGPDGRPLAVYPVPADWQSRTAPLRVPLGFELPDRPARLRRPTGRPAATGEVAELWFAAADSASAEGTGDLGRRWPDGSLEYIGRAGQDPIVDQAETVATLRDLPAVWDAVLTGGHGPDDPLVGYVAGPTTELDPVGVHNFLRTRLPAYLIPEQVLVLDALPRTAAGGYDLDALPRPDPGAVRQDYAAPRTSMERELTGLLEELLGLDQVGIHDSFFELGGFSMLATRLTSRIRANYHVDLALRDVFESPTVDELVQLIVRTQLSGADDLTALLDEIEDGGTEDGGTAASRSMPDGRPGRYREAVDRLREGASFGPDKPDETPETTARALWSAAAGSPRSIDRLEPEVPALSDAQVVAFDDLLDRRLAGAPLAYLTGRADFLGLELITGPGALIPRRESELLGGAALELTRELAAARGHVRILDLGTGCGNLAVLLAVREPRARVWASDLEPAAVSVAARNAVHHGVDDRVTLLCGDLFGALDDVIPPPGPFDLVVCNPPYLPTARATSLPAEIGGFEPTAAFDGGEIGLTVVYRLLAEAPRHLVPGGSVCFELGAGMGRVVTNHIDALGTYDHVRTVSDAAGVTRAIIARTRP